MKTKKYQIFDSSKLQIDGVVEDADQDQTMVDALTEDFAQLSRIIAQ